jgi:acetyltransferase-like isoleucine patch superfamily enzyme
VTNIFRKLLWIFKNRHNDTRLGSWDFFEFNQIEVGDKTYGHINVIAYNNRDKLKIGRYCSLAMESKFILGGDRDYDKKYLSPFLNPDHKEISKGDIIIEDDVVIGFGATILSGVTIGEGAVIGACSLVTKNVPSKCIVGGNPAKLIRVRL